MSVKYSKETDALFEGILALKTVEECYKFFEDLCTVNELLAMTQRFEVAKELDEGKTFVQISERSSASSATISRVNKCLLYGRGRVQARAGQTGPQRAIGREEHVYPRFAAQA